MAWELHMMEIKEGGMCEGNSWFIKLNHKYSAGNGGKMCEHCHSPNGEGDTQTWICPYVVVANNEAGCRDTGVCLECIIKEADRMNLCIPYKDFHEHWDMKI